MIGQEWGEDEEDFQGLSTKCKELTMEDESWSRRAIQLSMQKVWTFQLYFIC